MSQQDTERREQWGERRVADPTIIGVTQRLEMLHSDVSDVKYVLKELTIAINRLAIVEERLGNTSTALERAFKVLEKVEGRLAILESNAQSLKSEVEKSNLQNSAANVWVERGVAGIVVLLATMAAKKLGFM